MTHIRVPPSLRKRLARRRRPGPLPGQLTAKWQARPFDPAKMRILQFSRTPVAGVPFILRDIINKYTPHECKVLTAGAGYADGRHWTPGPDAFMRNIQAAHKLIAWADVVMVHNGRIPHPFNLRGKRLLCYYHSEPRNVDRRLERHGVPAYVIAQGHALLYPGLPRLPNLIDPDDALMRPEKEAPALPVRIGYAPSNKHGADYMRVNRYSPKGWPETMPTLERLRKEGLADIRVFHGVPFRKCMEDRKGCDIFIDEVLTGSYHRCTLEACCHRQVPVNFVCEEVRRLVAEVSGSAALPWLRSNAETLYDTLRHLIADREGLERQMADCRRWVEADWSPRKLLTQWYLPAFARAKVL